MKVTAEMMASIDTTHGIHGDTCGGCHARANVSAGRVPGWHCVCGHWNLMPWTDRSLGWARPKYGPPLTKIEWCECGGEMVDGECVDCTLAAAMASLAAKATRRRCRLVDVAEWDGEDHIPTRARIVAMLRDEAAKEQDSVTLWQHVDRRCRRHAAARDMLDRMADRIEGGDHE